MSRVPYRCGPEYDLRTAPILRASPLEVGTAIELVIYEGAPIRGTVAYAGEWSARITGVRGADHRLVVNARHGDLSLVSEGRTRRVVGVRLG